MTPLPAKPAPIRRRRLRSLLPGWPGRVFLALIVVVVAGYYFENWRGARALQAELDIMREKGLPVDWRDLLRGPVPDAENFGATPVLKGLADYKAGPVPGMESMQWDATRFAQPEKPEDWRKIRGQLSTSNFFTPPDSEADDVRAVYLALDHMEPVFAELTAAAGRRTALFTPSPKERHAAGNEGPFVFPTTSKPLTGITRLLEIRATAAVELGEPAAAMRMIRILRRMYEAAQVLDSTHTLAPFLPGIAGEGLRRHVWTPLHIEELSRILTIADPAAAVSATYHRFLLGDHDGIFEDQSGQLRFPSKTWWRYHLPPSGWRDQDAANLFRTAREQYILPVRTQGINFLTNKKPGAREDVWPQFAREVRTSVLFSEMMRRLAILGLAAEQHRLKTGRFPQTITEIPGAVPADQQPDLDGKPLRMEMSDDGKLFSLYSVGENLRDDGNAAPRHDRADSSDFDWSLRLPLP